jgi:hypothetical protein
MRSYSVAIASLAIGATQKWTDNVVSHYPIPDVVLERRGVARSIPHSALVRLAVTRELHVGLGLGVRDALALAGELLVAEPSGVQRGGHLRVTFDRAALEQSLHFRLRDALESAPTPRRGRPRQRASTPR